MARGKCTMKVRSDGSAGRATVQRQQTTVAPQSIVAMITRKRLLVMLSTFLSATGSQPGQKLFGPVSGAGRVPALVSFMEAALELLPVCAVALGCMVSWTG